MPISVGRIRGEDSAVASLDERSKLLGRHGLATSERLPLAHRLERRSDGDGGEVRRTFSANYAPSTCSGTLKQLNMDRVRVSIDRD